MFSVFLTLMQTTTAITIDWGMIAASGFPVVTIIVTWFLQRRTAKNEAQKVSDTALAAAAELQHNHDRDKAEAIERREREIQELIDGQADIKNTINEQLLSLAQMRIQDLQAQIRMAGGTTNGSPPTDVITASNLIHGLENELERLRKPKSKPKNKRKA